jgi:hypothetical protein
MARGCILNENGSVNTHAIRLKHYFHINDRNTFAGHQTTSSYLHESIANNYDHIYFIAPWH